MALEPVVTFNTNKGSYPAIGQGAAYWMNKNATDSDTALWATAPSGVTSGIGFIDALGSQKEVIRGNASSVESIRIYNNKAGAASIAACENCRLRVFDDNAGSPGTTQTTEPITGGGDATVAWTAVRQSNYYANGVAQTLSTGPYQLSSSEDSSSGDEPFASFQIDSTALQGVKDLVKVGQDLASYWILGKVTGGAAVASAEPHYILLKIASVIPTTATPSVWKWWIALEYTYVV